jgi:uroporphyrinogen decarboxylase
MTEMTPRERVMAALAHKEPDRVPVDFMGTAGCLVDMAYFALLDHLGLEGEGREFRQGESVRHYDERVLQALDVDFRRVWMRPPANWQPPPMDEGLSMDEWGMIRKRLGSITPFINTPLEHATISDLDSYPWPNPYDPGRVEGLADEARRLSETTDYAIAARAPLHGIYDLAHRLRGMVAFIKDMVRDKPFAAALVRKITEVQMGFYEAYLDAVGPYVDVVETVDDYGSQQTLLISPALFDELIAPARAELNALIKRKAPQARVFLHSDGAIFKLIPHLIETGVEILNPVEPDAAGNDSKALKDAFGDRLVFHGHLDVKTALRGTLEEVRAEVRRVVDGMAAGGGYIMAPTNHLLEDVPPENIVEVFRYAHAYGRYG